MIFIQHSICFIFSDFFYETLCRTLVFSKGGRSRIHYSHSVWFLCDCCLQAINTNRQLWIKVLSFWLVCMWLLSAGNKHKQKALKKGALPIAIQKTVQTGTSSSSSTTATTTTTTATTVTTSAATATTGTSTVNGKGSYAFKFSCMHLLCVPLLLFLGVLCRGPFTVVA